ncbi:MAG: serine O-acetyltransferase EpsC, partial [Stellaceae bacterium]
GLHAVMWHALSHRLWQRRWRLLARFSAHLARWFTGIEIHPAAKLGRRLVIDHGMGVVIGETAEIGDDCTLYQGVTLGGTSLARGAKRHPTLGGGVIVGSGAQVLGPFRVGDGARIGAAAVVLREVPEGATMVGNPARQAARHSAAGEPKPAFQPYGVCGDIPDPIARALNGLVDEVTSLRAHVSEIEQRAREAANADDASSATGTPALRLVASAGNGADDREPGARAS